MPLSEASLHLPEHCGIQSLDLENSATRTQGLCDAIIMACMLLSVARIKVGLFLYSRLKTYTHFQLYHIRSWISFSLHLWFHAVFIRLVIL